MLIGCMEKYFDDLFSEIENLVLGKKHGVRVSILVLFFKRYIT
jgi:hypothetical protein